MFRRQNFQKEVISMENEEMQDMKEADDMDTVGEFQKTTKNFSFDCKFSRDFLT